jgi:hypothetical protein
MLTNRQSGAILLHVPLAALQNVYSVPQSVIKGYGDGSVHGLLALSQSLDMSPSQAQWRAVLPTMEDFQEIMPLLWDEMLQNLLPPRSKELLEKQQKKIEIDWYAISKAFPSVMKDEYRYYWLLVNTRSFYWVTPGSKRPPPREDCLAQVPFADYFNHSDTGCTKSSGSFGIKITSDRVYEVGEEIHLSYGPHSNDFLLSEYGFILDKNKWDEVRLDEVILPEISKEHQELLEEAGYLGKYVLDQDSVCHRTQVALRVLCVPHRRWRRFISGEDDGESDQPSVDDILCKLLLNQLRHAKEVLEIITCCSVGLDVQREMLSRRWNQIVALVSSSIVKLQRP